MKNLKLLYAAFIFTSIVGYGQNNKEKIVGAWELTSVKPLNNGVVDEKMNNDIQHYINFYNLKRIYFGSDKRFKHYEGLKEQEPNDLIEYRLTDEKDLPNYPNFKFENQNGRWIAFVLFNKNGSLYQGTNILSPIEIISISADELSLKLHDKNHALEPSLNKFIVKYKHDQTSETVVDIDGNVYHTITIGTQIWMVENLKTTKFNDGSPIPYIQEDPAWEKVPYSAFCWYENNNNYNKIYGALYNGYAVSTGKLAPMGWHVPTEAEWLILINYLGGTNIAGIQLKEAGKAHWKIPEWVTTKDLSTNKSGFTALPAGTRHFQSSESDAMSFGGLNEVSQFQSSSGSGIYLDVNAGVSMSSGSKNAGLSVRCIKNN